MTLRTRLLVMLVAPMLALGWLSAASMRAEMADVRELRANRELIALAVRASALVHEVQKERGLSSAFVGSRGRSAGADLPAQRQQTDRKLEELRNALAAVPDLAASARDSAQGALDALAHVAATRARIDRFEIAPQEVVEEFSTSIDRVLDLVQGIVRSSTDPTTVRRAMAYVSFLRAKEQVGRERAYLATAFGAHALDGVLLKRAVDVLARQDSQLSTFRAYASPEEQASYDARLGGGRFADVAEMRRIALERPPGSPLGVDPALWLRAITAKIDAMKEVEDGMASSLGDYLVGAEAAASRSLVLQAVLLLAAVAVALALAFLQARKVLRQIRDLVQETSKLREAVDEGELRVRADPERIHPEFRPIILGMNETMDAFCRPIALTADYVDRISKGDVPPKIEESFRGGFAVTRDNLNRCIDAIGALIADIRMLSQAAVEGKLSTRADASRHTGEFRRIVEGVNETLDAVIAPVEEAARVLDELARRDLRARMNGQYQGDHARVKESLNATADSLHRALVQVAAAAEQVSAAAGQIASSSQSVASGASEQASSIEETSASLQSMSLTTRSSAENAQVADDLARSAKTAAGDGTAAMTQVQSAMERIRTSAQGTSDIIKDINEIAFQTNLLALNAAVEAARAGDAGRGFAVVAEEVRSLALRSKEAANRTEVLIRESVKEAEQGVVTLQAASGKLSQIALSVDKVTGVVAEIAAATKEQAAGIDQVNGAVGEMQKVTQQNAASSEQSSSAAQELSSQAEELASIVRSFQLDQRATAPGPAKDTVPARGRGARRRAEVTAAA